jgi:hypothetical protein
MVCTGTLYCCDGKSGTLRWARQVDYASRWRIQEILTFWVRKSLKTTAGKTKKKVPGCINSRIILRK